MVGGGKCMTERNVRLERKNGAGSGIGEGVELVMVEGKKRGWGEGVG